MKKKADFGQTQENKPGWLNMKNILGVLTALGVLGGGGAAIGYNQKDSQEIQVQHVDTREVLNGLYDVIEMNQKMQSEKDKNQNQWIEQAYDEMRTNYKELKSDVKDLKTDLKDLKKCLEERSALKQPNDINLTTIE
jgi:uncharacterized protein HemX